MIYLWTDLLMRIYTDLTMLCVLLAHLMNMMKSMMSEVRRRRSDLIVVVEGICPVLCVMIAQSRAVLRG